MQTSPRAPSMPKGGAASVPPTHLARPTGSAAVAPAVTRRDRNTNRLVICGNSAPLNRKFSTFPSKPHGRQPARLSADERRHAPREPATVWRRRGTRYAPQQPRVRRRAALTPTDAGPIMPIWRKGDAVIGGVRGFRPAPGRAVRRRGQRYRTEGLTSYPSLLPNSACNFRLDLSTYVIQSRPHV